ncbi:MAG: amino acid adenylation domain-containing protein, partial [Flavobacteriales bacterium]|nr:amino acid adenylation domain-containing protein [Flavobacteriales bacterium]
LYKKGVALAVEQDNLLIDDVNNILDSDLISGIKQHKTSLITLLNKLNTASTEIILDEKITRTFPYLFDCSFSQKRMLFMQSLAGEQSFYNLPFAYKISGLLNIDALNSALIGLVNKHDILRTTYLLQDGEYVQQVNPFISADSEQFTLKIEDISDGIDIEPGVKERLKEDAEHRFNLEDEYPIKASLFKLNDSEFVLSINIHHIAADGWSAQKIIQDINQGYKLHLNQPGERINNVSSVDDISIFQYVDYAKWQKKWLQSQPYLEARDYWLTKLQGLPELHNFPTEHIRPTSLSVKGETYKQVITGPLVSELTRLAKEHKATPFVLIQAVFAAFLARYTNDRDIVFGTAVANRQPVEFMDTVGLFVNTLVLRYSLESGGSFTDLVAQAKLVNKDALKYQQFPFDQLVDELKPTRSLGYNPLVQIMLVMQDDSADLLNLTNVQTEVLPLYQAVSKFDFTLAVKLTANKLILSWEYATDLFEAATVERMSSHFELLMANALAQPDILLEQVEFITPTERYQQLVEWNNTAADFPKDKCIHELFEEQVKINPDAVAVVYEECQLTYGELNYKANQLAHYLMNERQVKPDRLVGICVDRSLDMIVAIMGVLKAGGAYVPLDPSYPAARLAYMLDDANLSTVLTQGKLKGETPLSDDQAVYLDSENILTKLQSYSGNNPKLETLTSSHLAYVIYTSGSTGNPKGVMVEHLSLMNLVCFDQLLFEINRNSRFLHTLSLGFDAGNGYLFDVLSSGGAIYLIEIFDDLCRYANEKNISHLVLPAARLNNLAFHPMESLCYLISGGDDIKSNVLEQFGENSNLFNVYGPTECTVTATCTKVMLENLSSIGKPIANTQSYVLSDNLLISPVGASGELHIGGAGLARGYLNQPELTAEKFIPNPFYDATNPNSSKRLYKTGDLVRYLPDGNLEFLGRIDHQVKIRGFRIELSEIEQQLLAHSEVNEAVVVALSNDEGDKRLVAYITHNEAKLMLDESNNSQVLLTELIDSLRQQLSQYLPDYMVPSAFVVLEHLPLTPNGKIDRKGL